MAGDDFLRSFVSFMESCPEERLDEGARYLVLGDLHLGDGGDADEFARNRKLLRSLLLERYLPEGWTLVLNGDVEDLSAFWMRDIRHSWSKLFDAFTAFSARGRLRKIVGNRDIGLLRKTQYPFRLQHGLRLARGDRSILILHGHQASRWFWKRDYLRDFVPAYLAGLGSVKRKGVAGDWPQVIATERRLYEAALRTGAAIVFGHTHRQLFESRTQAGSLRREIEELIMECDPKAAISRLPDRLIDLYRREIDLGGDRTHAASFELGEDFPSPLLFNPGKAAGKRSLSCLEIAEGGISLVRWRRASAARAAARDGAPGSEALAPVGALRRVVASCSLDSVFGRAERLAAAGEAAAVEGLRGGALEPSFAES